MRVKLSCIWSAEGEEIPWPKLEGLGQWTIVARPDRVPSGRKIMLTT